LPEVTDLGSRGGLLPCTWLHAPSIEATEDLLDRFLLHGQTITSFDVSTTVPPRPPSPS
jgi:hypothetical protein